MPRMEWTDFDDFLLEFSFCFTKRESCSKRAHFFPMFRLRNRKLKSNAPRRKFSKKKKKIKQVTRRHFNRKIKTDRICYLSSRHVNCKY